MHHGSWLLTVALALSPRAASARPLGLTLSSDPSGTVATLRTDAPQIEPDAIRIPGYRAATTPGYPALPSAELLFALPPDAQGQLVVESVSFHDIGGVWIAPPPTTPQNGADDDGPVTYAAVADPGIYATDDFVPAQPVATDGQGIARDVDFIRIRVTPALWNPVTQVLRVYDEIRFRIDHRLVPSTTPGTFDVDGPLSSHRERGIQRTRPSGSLRPVTRSAPLFANSPLPSEWFRRRTTPEAAATQRTANPAATDGSLKIEIEADGLYTLSGTRLATSGFPIPVAFADLRLALGGTAVRFLPIDVNGDGQLGAPDGLWFYGKRNPDRFTTTHVYWLSRTGGGTQMGRIPAFPTGHPSYPSVASARSTIRDERNELLFTATGVHPREWNPWVSKTQLISFCYSSNPACDCATFPTDPVLCPLNPCQGPPNFSAHTVAVTADRVAPSVPGRIYAVRAAVASAPLAGCIPAAQELELTVNGTVIGTAGWDADPDALQHTVRVPLDPAIVREGANTVQVRQLAQVPGLRRVNLDWIELEYERQLRPVGGVLEFDGNWPQGAVFYVRGVPSRDVVAAAIRTDGTADLLEGVRWLSLGPGMPETLTFAVAPSPQAQRIVVYERSALLRPPTIYADTPSNLRDRALRGTHLTIAHDDLITAASALTDYRRGQGLSAQLVSVQDVYDEFSWGNIDSDGIRDFMAFVLSGIGWAEPPLYVTLVGDTTDDFQDYRGHAVRLLVPHGEHINTNRGPGRLVSSDAYYQTVVGNDAVPDVLMGRIAAQTPAEVTTYVDKLVRYEAQPPGAPWNRRSLTVVDDDMEEIGMCDPRLDLVETTMTNLVCCYLGEADPADATLVLEDDYGWPEGHDVLLDERNAGVAMSTYFGHGSVTKFGKKCNTALLDIFGTADAPLLTHPTALPLHTAVSCNVGKVDWVEINNGYSRCMAEAFTVGAANADVAFIAGTTSITPLDGFGHAEGFFDGLYNPVSGFLPPFIAAPAAERAGALHFASMIGLLLNPRVVAQREDAARSLILFGDPAAILKIEAPPTPRPDLCPDPNACLNR